MNIIDRLIGILDDRCVDQGQLRVTVNELSGTINIIITPDSNLPDHYDVITMENH